MTKQLNDVYLTKEQFEKDLLQCLSIIDFPTEKNPFYVCNHLSAALYQRKVHVYILNQ